MKKVGRMKGKSSCSTKYEMSLNPKKPLVLKFGGSSMATPDLVKQVAKIIHNHHKTNQKLVVVVSAMGKSTDNLINLARAVNAKADSDSNRREMDMLLSTGERVSIALLCLALSDLGLDAISLTGAQSGILTDLVFGEAQISEIKPIRIEESLNQEKIVVVAGFQGVSREKKEITTLGRGGSDTTAVALAVTLNASECLIYTDVAGVFDADPKLVPSAKVLEKITWNEAAEAASHGSKVLHSRCVELAWKYKMPLRILSTFEPQKSGTLVFGERQNPAQNLVSSENNILESAKATTLSSQELIWLEGCTSTNAGQRIDSIKLFEKCLGKGIKPVAWSENQGQIHFGVNINQKSLLKSVEELSSFKKTPLTRITLSGCGFEAYPSIYIEVQSRLNKEGLPCPEHISLQPHVFDIYTRPENAPKTLQTLTGLLGF